MIKADLHCHTTLSDGSASNFDALKLAQKHNVTHLAITNHDTVNGLKEAVMLGRRMGIEVIPGIEISAYDTHRRRKVHLLGYHFDLEAPNIKKLCDGMLKRRHQLSLYQCELIKDQGYTLDETSLLGKISDGGVLYKQHIMQTLIEEGATDCLYGSLYQSLFKGGGPCDIEIEFIDIFDALAAIIADGGVAVLAHPGQLNSYDLVKDLVNKGLKGIEKYHCTHTLEDELKVQALADQYDLFITGGSDYHGIYGNELMIGSFLTPIASLDFVQQYKKLKLDESLSV